MRNGCWRGLVTLSTILAIRLSWCVLKEKDREGGILKQEAHVTCGAARQ